MSIKPFALERYFANHEFSSKYLMSASDCEAFFVEELLQMASSQSQSLWNDLKLNYTESAGHPFLREEIANLYPKHSLNDVLVAAPEELIFIAMQNLVIPSDHVIVISPNYQSLHSIVESIGCEVTKWRIQLVDGKWIVDIGELVGLIKPNTRMLIINFPNNPTGYLPSRYEIDQIVSLCREYNLFLFSDEMYRLLEYDKEQRLPAISEIYEKGISLSGLSKSFALPGLRIGWLTSTDPQLLAKFLEYKDYTTICNSAPSEILGIIALENTQSILNRNLAIIKENIQLSESAFARIPNLVQWISPIAGSIAFPKWKGNLQMAEVCERLITAEELMLVPGSFFDYSNHHFRVGLGRKNYAESLSIFEKFVTTKKLK